MTVTLPRRTRGLVRIERDNPGTDDFIRVASRAAEGARLSSCSLGDQTRHTLEPAILAGVDADAGGRDRDAERHGISPYSSLFCLDRAGRYHKAHFRQLNEIVLLPALTQSVPGPIGRADNFAKNCSIISSFSAS